MNHQDWKTIVLRKSTTQEKGARKQAQVRVSKGPSKEQRAAEDNPDQFSRAKVSRTMAQQISKARIARKMTQKQLASLLNVPAKTIQDYESGKAIPQGSLIARLNRTLGITIVRDDKRGRGGGGGKK